MSSSIQPVLTSYFGKEGSEKGFIQDLAQRVVGRGRESEPSQDLASRRKE